MRVETQHIQLAASTVVQKVLMDRRNLNQVLDDAMRDRRDWEPFQRAALQDLSYGTLRYYGRLNAMLSMLLHRPLADMQLRFLLLVAMYQLEHGKSAPHAVVDHSVRGAHTLNPRAGGLVNAVLRNFLRNHDKLAEESAREPTARYSYPKWWIDELGLQYGEFSHEILEEGNRHPPMTLRVNGRRIDPAAYLALLEQTGLSARMVGPGALQLDKPLPVDKLPGFFEGLVSVQDAGAQYAALLLDVRDGMRVLDACAAPGGKTAHVLETATVEMTAVDRDEKRLQRIVETLRRLGLTAKLMVGDAARPSDWWDGSPFDRILADVPCSASGVVRRHPDIKWLRRRDDLAGFAEQQLAILGALWSLLAQGGKLLYTTCSVFRQENQQVITRFLAQQENARQHPVSLTGSCDGQLLPNDQHDGFFYALLQKTA